MEQSSNLIIVSVSQRFMMEIFAEMLERKEPASAFVTLDRLSDPQTGKEIKIPKDSRVWSCNANYADRCVNFLVEHESFPYVPDGDSVPIYRACFAYKENPGAEPIILDPKAT